MIGQDYHRNRGFESGVKAERKRTIEILEVMHIVAAENEFCERTLLEVGKAVKK